jgi:hypothetical protein
MSIEVTEVINKVTVTALPPNTVTTSPTPAAGPSHATYTHTQNSASATWTINHNLNCYPSVTIVDSAGSVVIGDVSYTNANTLVVTFVAAFGGKAYLN